MSGSNAKRAEALCPRLYARRRSIQRATDRMRRGMRRLVVEQPEQDMNGRQSSRALRAMLGVAAAATCTTSCAAPVASSATAEDVPSEAQVVTLLEASHDARKTPKELCGLATSDLNCEESLGTAPATPQEAPTLVCTGAFDAPEGFVDGTLARVQGVDGDGGTYDKTLLAIMTGEGPRFVDSVYWAAAGISVGHTTDEVNSVELDC